ncbi:MAG: putative quinol monooxygenase [Smithellaceae bacterium]
MILVIIRMNVLPAKRKELLQTFTSLIVSIRMDKGCNRCDVCQSMEDENKILLIEEWDSQENLKIHLKSGRFRVIAGSTNLLQEPYEMMFHRVFHLNGVEET